MEERDVSQRELARRLAGEGASAKRRENVRRQIGRWTRGENAPNKRNARKLAESLAMPLDFFVTSARRAGDGAVIARLEERVDNLAEQLQQLQAARRADANERGAAP